MTAKNIVSLEAVNEKMTSYETAQRERITELWETVEFSKGLATVSKTALRGNKNRERGQRGSGSEASCETSSREVRRPKVNTSMVWKDQFGDQS